MFESADEYRALSRNRCHGYGKHSTQQSVGSDEDCEDLIVYEDNRENNREDNDEDNDNTVPEEHELSVRVRQRRQWTADEVTLVWCL